MRVAAYNTAIKQGKPPPLRTSSPLLAVTQKKELRTAVEQQKRLQTNMAYNTRGCASTNENHVLLHQPAIHICSKTQPESYRSSSSVLRTPSTLSGSFTGGLAVKEYTQVDGQDVDVSPAGVRDLHFVRRVSDVLLQQTIRY